ncbi:uncharacterized protein LOC107044761 [Diachasma alloeum]|uniref:uncharacterized protein LOC107044761 n=1 Tax=Diachasma alloeum TaxID=454923 RepID=UPI00073849AE|nr:uncharacterized protein LOC107044761 [Diachasma alloeum]
MATIIHIAAKSGSKEFSVYVNPQQHFFPEATAVTSLINCNGMLLLHGKQVSTRPLQDALGDFLEWIKSFDRKCCLVAHNLISDGPRLYDAVRKCNYEENFSNLIHGFVDTLPVIRKNKNVKRPNQCKLSVLAKSLNISVEGVHNAILSKVLKGMEISNAVLLENEKLYDRHVIAWSNNDLNKENISTSVKRLSALIRKKLSDAAISIKNLRNIYSSDNGADAIRECFRDKIQKKDIKLQAKTIDKIITFVAKVH